MTRDNIMDNIVDDFTPHQPGLRRRVTKVALLNNGKWSFVSLDSLDFKRIDDYNDAAQLFQKFSLLIETETDPRNGSFYGGSTDYIIKDKFGNLLLATQETFMKMFP